VNDGAMELLNNLNIMPADLYPKVTEHVNDIIALVEKLLAKGFAYETKTGVYFDVSKFPAYGRLSGQRLEELRAGSRKEVDESKRNALDFALWKKSKGELLEFDSPWGRGRPGWHIECSAMAMKYAGETIDIHGGAQDLIFPHHENEIAQSEAATAKRFVRFWMHTGFLTVNGEKMSKSLGNFTTLSQSMQRFSANAHRLFFIQSHYRSPVNYEEAALARAEESAERIFNSIGLIEEKLQQQGNKLNREYRKKSDQLISDFYSAMDDDFDTPSALSVLFTLLRVTNSHLNSSFIDKKQLEKVRKTIHEMLWIFGLQDKQIHSQDLNMHDIKNLAIGLGIKTEKYNTTHLLDKIVQKREESRNKKDFKKADEIREKLAKLGILLEDKKGSTKWKAKQ